MEFHARDAVVDERDRDLALRAMTRKGILTPLRRNS